MTEVFVPDFHETDEAGPIVYNLERLSLEWNMVEQFFTGLIWTLLGSHETGMAVTGGLGNQSKAEIVRDLTRLLPTNEQLISDVDFACKAFNIMRENRNILIHSHSIFPTEDGSVHWRRATGRGPKGHLTTRASLDDLEQLIAETIQLGLLVVDIIGVVNALREGAPEQRRRLVFDMPKRLAQVSSE